MKMILQKIQSITSTVVKDIVAKRVGAYPLGFDQIQSIHIIKAERVGAN